VAARAGLGSPFKPWFQTYPRQCVWTSPLIDRDFATVLARRTTIFVFVHAIQAQVEDFLLLSNWTAPSGSSCLNLYGLTVGFSRSQCSTHFTVLTSTAAFLCPEKLMSGRMNSVCGPLATLKEQLKLIDCTPRSLHPV
jgi:hypothetical protein